MTVRRAVTMRGAAEDPGGVLTPGGGQSGPRGRAEAQSAASAEPAAGTGTPAAAEEPESGAPKGRQPEAAGSDGAREEAERPDGAAAGPSAVAGASAVAGPSAAAGASAGAGPSAVAGGGVPESVAEGASGSAATASASGPAAAVSASEPAGASPDATAAVAASGGGGAGARALAGGEPPSGRPKKPMLAAAAIVGAILISVPILVAGRDDREPERERTETVAGTVMDDSERLAVPGTYTSESPSPSPSPTPSEVKEKKKAEPKRAPEPAVVKEAVSASPSESESRPTATVTARAPLNTAATAVNRLARNDPDGRHICYRAFVSGRGWQTPVCDGTMAGTAGQGKQITALNIAVWKVGGAAANALLHDPGSTSGNAKWQPQWTAITADGKNVYIGSSKKGAPFMTGFAMNVGTGSVCQSVRMQGGDWSAQYCKNARPEYLFGGTTDNARWFEALKLTV
ncbi:hydrogenase expression protein HypA [Streptomyces griseoviridis]